MKTGTKVGIITSLLTLLVLILELTTGIMGIFSPSPPVEIHNNFIIKGDSLLNLGKTKPALDNYAEALIRDSKSKEAKEMFQKTTSLLLSDSMNQVTGPLSELRGLFIHLTRKKGSGKKSRIWLKELKGKLKETGWPNTFLSSKNRNRNFISKHYENNPQSGFNIYYQGEGELQKAEILMEHIQSMFMGVPIRILEKNEVLEGDSIIEVIVL